MEIVKSFIEKYQITIYSLSYQFILERRYNDIVFKHFIYSSETLNLGISNSTRVL